MAQQQRSRPRGITVARTLVLVALLAASCFSWMWLYRWGGMQRMQQAWRKAQDAEAARKALQVVKDHRTPGESSLATRVETLARRLSSQGARVSDPEWKATPASGRPGTWIVSATLKGNGLDQTLTWNVLPDKGEVIAADANAERLGELEQAVAQAQAEETSPASSGSPATRLGRSNPFQPPEASSSPARVAPPRVRWPKLPPRRVGTASPSPGPSRPLSSTVLSAPSSALDLELIGVTQARGTVVALVRHQGQLREVWAGSALGNGWRVQAITPLGRTGSTLVVTRGKEKRVCRLALVAPPSDPGPAPRAPAPPAPPSAPRASKEGFPSIPREPREPAPPSGEPSPPGPGGGPQHGAPPPDSPASPPTGH